MRARVDVQGNVDEKVDEKQCLQTVGYSVYLCHIRASYPRSLKNDPKKIFVILGTFFFFFGKVAIFNFYIIPSFILFLINIKKKPNLSGVLSSTGSIQKKIEHHRIETPIATTPLHTRRTYILSMIPMRFMDN